MLFSKLFRQVKLWNNIEITFDFIYHLKLIVIFYYHTVSLSCSNTFRTSLTNSKTVEIIWHGQGNTLQHPNDPIKSQISDASVGLGPAVSGRQVAFTSSPILSCNERAVLPKQTGSLERHNSYLSNPGSCSYHNTNGVKKGIGLYSM